MTIVYCPNCEKDTNCTHEAELYVCEECGEDFAKYIVPRKLSDSDVSMTQDVSTDIKTPQSIENTNPDYYKDELYLDEDFRMLAKTYPADVSAIGVTTLIDYVEAVEAELARLTAELAEDEFDSMPIEKINQYLREHGYNPEKVGLRGKILYEALTKNIIAREIIQRFLNNEGGCRFCDFGVLRKPGIPEKDHDEDCLYLAARAYLDNDTSVVVKRDLSDAEIEELGAQEAESRGD